MYRYQLHTHTVPCSLCARMSPEELCHALYEGGYAGAVLTNHFFHGNTGVDRALPFADFVKPYIEDYEACKRAAEPYGLDILFGLEEGVGGGLEILCYGLTPEILLRHPELSTSAAAVWHDVLHAEGVLVVQAHPFRERAYITTPGPLPLTVIDGVEAYNRGNIGDENARACALAAKHPTLIVTSGADAHEPRSVTVGGIETERRIRNEAELAEILRSGEYTPIALP
ncbi:MAG: PHP domain-containing protein [Clostridia bacterium]|nr:PHP domain-containing protein [Clostridia bacterium]